MSDTSLSLEEYLEGKTLILSVGGRIDSGNANDFSEQLLQVFERAEGRVLIDFARLAYLTSAGFRVLLVASDQAEENGVSMCLCAMTSAVYDLFEIGGLSDIFEIFGTRQEALSA